MIRRLFWLTVGALVGVTGYRRVSRLARAITPGGRRRPGPRASGGLGWARGAALFARDVREGMDLYADRHPRLAGRTLEGQRDRAQRHGRTFPGIDYAKDGR